MIGFVLMSVGTRKQRKPNKPISKDASPTFRNRNTSATGKSTINSTQNKKLLLINKQDQKGIRLKLTRLIGNRIEYLYQLAKPKSLSYQSNWHLRGFGTQVFCVKQTKGIFPLQ